MRSRLALLLLLAACIRSGPAPAAPPPVVPERHALLREQARRLLTAPCGKCHVGSRPTARPAALAVFDLEQADWSARMSARQLGSLQRRMDGVEATALQREQLRQYVAVEQARRSTP